MTLITLCFKIRLEEIFQVVYVLFADIELSLNSEG